MLILVAAWAVVAVILLAGTLSATYSIQRRVDRTRQSLSRADRDLDYVRLTHRTAELAEQIVLAVRPLSRRLATEATTTRSISAKTRSINRTVFAIDRTVGSIDASAASIEGHARPISANALVIDRSVAGIATDATSVGVHLTSTSNSVTQVKTRFTTIRVLARSIDRGVSATNARVRSAIGITAQIEARLGAILDQVGSGHGTPADAPIHGHVNSIDCRVGGSQCDR
jgi:methyl-accepting chemotaxis protein